VNFVFPRIMKTGQTPISAQLFLEAASDTENPNDGPYQRYVTFQPGTRSYLIDEGGQLIDSVMADWRGGQTHSPAATAGVVLTDHGWAGADTLAIPAAETRVAGIRFDVVLPSTHQILTSGRVSVKINGIEEERNPLSAVFFEDSASSSNGGPGSGTVLGTAVVPSRSHDPALPDPPLAVNRMLSLPPSPNGVFHLEFADFADTVLEGQLVTVNFIFPRIMKTGNSPISAQVFLETAENTQTPSSNNPYQRYVKFETGTRAYLIDENGQLVESLMADWRGGRAYSPAATAGVILTREGWAGADMIATAATGLRVGGVRFDLMFPATNQALTAGRITVKINGIEEEQNPLSAFFIPESNPDTEPPAEGVQPSIGGISVTHRTPASVTINWNTDGVATAIEYGTSPFYGQSASPAPGVENNYSVDLSGLSMNTTYHYRITARDSQGNIAVSEDNAFLTGFSISNLTAIARATDGLGPKVTGYGRAAITAGTAPSGLAIFGSHDGDLLVNEFAVPATPLMTSGRVYFEVSGDGLLKTSMSIANPNIQDATVTFELRNVEGGIYQSGSFTLTGTAGSCDPELICNQLSRYVDDFPFMSGRNIEGTLSFTSTAPVAVSAYRTLYNERTPRDLLMTNLPVVDLATSSVHETPVIPHFLLGNGMSTRLVLMNTTGKQLQGSVKFLDSAGAPMLVNHSGTLVDTLPYSIASNGAERVVILQGPSPQSGSAWVVPMGDDPAPETLSMLSYKPADYTLAESITSVTMGTAFRMYVELSASDRISTAVAFANASSAAGSVTLSLTDLDGNLVASETRALAPSGKIVASIESLLPSLAGGSVRGILRITTDLPSLSVVGFRERFNNRQPAPDYLFTGIVPVRETGAPQQDLIFSQLADGYGISLEIVLYSGTAGATSQGNLFFIRPDGTPFTLDLH